MAQRPNDPRRALGAEGEQRAARFLVERGYRIVARNCRSDGVEIDLIASRGAWIVFVEVKTRRWRADGAPEEVLDARQCARLVRAGAAWLRAHRARSRRVRFDLISCLVAPSTSGRGKAERWEILHRPGAFDAGGL